MCSENNDIVVLYLHVNVVIFESDTLPGFTIFIGQKMPLHLEMQVDAAMPALIDLHVEDNATATIHKYIILQYLHQEVMVC